jgi:hypothetical protein
MIIEKFSKAELLDYGLPYDMDSNIGKILSDRIISKTRWSILHELIFCFHNEDKAWKIVYNSPATEYQDCDPFDNIVKGVLVHQIEKTVKVWEEV